MTDPNRSEIRGTAQGRLIGTLAGWIMKIWSRTLRYNLEDHSGVLNTDARPPVIFAMWHNRIFCIPPLWARTGGRNHPLSVLTSASRDGAILESALAVFKMGAIRGSTSRRAVAALVGLRRTLREGTDVCITPDGPRGPRYTFHAGIVKLAESSGAPILPVHVRFDSAWRLKTWDRLVIPKPFSQVSVIFDERLVVPPKLDDDAFEAACARIEQRLRDGIDDP